MGILLTIVLGIIQLFLAGLGVYVSIKPPEKKWHLALISIFIICGSIGIGISAYLQYKNNSDNNQFRNNITGLNGQIKSLLNATKTQATIDDVRKIGSDVQNEIQFGFDRVIAAINKEKPPVATPKEPVTTPTVEGMRLIQKATISDNPDFPYGLQVIIQSNVAIQPVGVGLKCDGKIGKMSYFIAGQTVYFNVRTLVQENIAELSIGSPALTPAQPLVITLLSKTQIREIDAYKIKQ